MIVSTLFFLIWFQTLTTLVANPGRRLAYRSPANDILVKNANLLHDLLTEFDDIGSADMPLINKCVDRMIEEMNISARLEDSTLLVVYTVFRRLEEYANLENSLGDDRINAMSSSMRLMLKHKQESPLEQWDKPDIFQFGVINNFLADLRKPKNERFENLFYLLVEMDRLFTLTNYFETQLTDRDKNRVVGVIRKVKSGGDKEQFEYKFMKRMKSFLDYFTKDFESRKRKQLADYNGK